MSENKEFIKEKIVKKTGAGKGFRSFVKITASAILFGVIAAVVFAVTAPVAINSFVTETETTTEEVVVIPRDEPETQATLEVMSSSVEETSEAINDGEVENDITEAETTAPVEELVQEAIEGYKYSVEDLESMWSSAARLCNDLDPSIVTVRIKGQTEDMFGNLHKGESEFSGVIIAETYTESMILTSAVALDDINSIEIEWANGSTQQAYLRKMDKVADLAVICARKHDMNQSTKASAIPVELGNSYQVGRGDMLIAAGSPLGQVHSTAYSWASYVEYKHPDIDMNKRLIYINSQMDTEKGTWMFNTKGELVGWTETPEDIYNKNGKTAISGISDYKSLLESMINSADSAYIGIIPSETPYEDGEEEKPRGIYVMETVNEGPAYNAGILAGDIISEINDVVIRSVEEYEQELENLRPDDEITVVLHREARGEYKDMEYKLTVAAR